MIWTILHLMRKQDDDIEWTDQLNVITEEIMQPSIAFMNLHMYQGQVARYLHVWIC